MGPEVGIEEKTFHEKLVILVLAHYDNSKYALLPPVKCLMLLVSLLESPRDQH